MRKAAETPLEGSVRRPGAGLLSGVETPVQDGVPRGRGVARIVPRGGPKARRLKRSPVADSPLFMSHQKN
jgi:hypothetical protein